MKFIEQLLIVVMFAGLFDTMALLENVLNFQ
jgi:hypothetical protein